MTTSNPRSRVAEAARLYGAGLTASEVATQLGVSERTVREWLGAELRRTGPRGRTDVTDAEIIEMRDVAGMTWRQIATELGMSSPGVRARYKVATGGRRWR